MPDLDDLADAAKDLIGDHTDEVKEGIDVAAGLVGDAVGDKKTARSVAKTVKGAVDDLDGERHRKAKGPAKKARKPPSS